MSFLWRKETQLRKGLIHIDKTRLVHNNSEMPKHKKKAKHRHQSTSLNTTSNHHTVIPAEKINLDASIQQNTLESGNPSSPPTNPVMTSSQKNTTIVQEISTIMTSHSQIKNTQQQIRKFPRS